MCVFGSEVEARRLNESWPQEPAEEHDSSSQDLNAAERDSTDGSLHRSDTASSSDVWTGLGALDEIEHTTTFHSSATELARRLVQLRFNKLIENIRGNPLFTPQHLDVIQEAAGAILGADEDSRDQEAFEFDSRSESDALLPVRGGFVGSYQIESLIGRGGAANVYQATSPKGDRVAIKLLRERRFEDRFEREIELVQQLAHPNIVIAYEAGSFRGQSFLAMEYLSGPNLYQHVQRSGPLSWQASVNVIHQAALGLQHAHQRGLVHRDIKPGNLIFDGADRVKLADLGLAVLRLDGPKDAGEEMATKMSFLGGTPGYMSPEQADSLTLATVRSDLFSLGMTWHFLLTGESRNPGEDTGEKLVNLRRNELSELPDGICPPQVASILIHMTKHDPEQRLQSMDELIAFLEPYVSNAELGAGNDAPALRVLVVEDQDDDLFFTLETLRRSNEVIETSEVSCLADAIVSLQSPDASFDAVLLDLDLIDSVGVETVERVRQAAPEVPLIVLTGNDDLEVGRACIEAGADEYVCKSELTAGRLERSIFITESRVRQRDSH